MGLRSAPKTGGGFWDLAPGAMGNSDLGIALPDKCNMAGDHCALCTVFPQVISGLRKPIAIQTAISFNMNLPEGRSCRG